MQVVIASVVPGATLPPVIPTRYLASRVPSILQQDVPSTLLSAGVLGFWIAPRITATPVFVSDNERGSISPVVGIHLPVIGSVRNSLSPIVMIWTCTTLPNTSALAFALSLSGTRMSPSALLMTIVAPVPGLSTARLKWYEVTFWIAFCALLINCCAEGGPPSLPHAAKVSKMSTTSICEGCKRLRCLYMSPPVGSDDTRGIFKAGLIALCFHILS